MKYKSIFNDDASLLEIQETIQKLYSGINVQLQEIREEIDIVCNKERIQSAKRLRKHLNNVFVDVKKLKTSLLEHKIRISNTEKADYVELFEILKMFFSIETESCKDVSKSDDTVRQNLTSVQESIESIKSALIDYQKVVKNNRQKQEYV